MSETVQKWMVKMIDPISGEWKKICLTSDKQYIENIIKQLEEEGESCELEEVYVQQ